MQDKSPESSPERAQLPYGRQRTKSDKTLEFSEGRRLTSATHNSKLSVAKLIDGYLAGIARGP